MPAKAVPVVVTKPKKLRKKKRLGMGLGRLESLTPPAEPTDEDLSGTGATGGA